MISLIKKCHSRNAKMIRKQNVSIVDSLRFAEDNDLIFCIFQKKPLFIPFLNIQSNKIKENEINIHFLYNSIIIFKKLYHYINFAL